MMMKAIMTRRKCRARIRKVELAMASD